MTVSPDWLKAQAARLFQMASEARQKGDEPLAALLIKQAHRCLVRLNERETAQPPPTPPAPTQQPFTLQQQQIQPKKK